MSVQHAIQISGKLISENQVSVSFTVLPGSDPYLLGCFIAVWKGQEFQSSAEALQLVRLVANQQSGQVIFDNLNPDQQDYTIGFGLGLQTNSEVICAGLSLPLQADTSTDLQVMLSNISVIPDEIGTDFLVAQLPISFCNKVNLTSSWIALFKGGFKPGVYTTGSLMIAMNKVNPDRNSGKVVMNNIRSSLERFETYTMVLGMGFNDQGHPDFSKLVSSCTFIVWKSKIYAGQGAYTSPNSQLSVSL